MSKCLNDVFLFLKIILILANSADPNEMLTFHLSLQLLSKYCFTCIQNEKR